jgi:hypothetical protein
MSSTDSTYSTYTSTSASSESYINSNCNSMDFPIFYINDYLSMSEYGVFADYIRPLQPGDYMRAYTYLQDQYQYPSCCYNGLYRY